jgi:hypothetical protein
VRATRLGRKRVAVACTARLAESSDGQRLELLKPTAARDSRFPIQSSRSSETVRQRQSRHAVPTDETLGCWQWRTCMSCNGVLRAGCCVLGVVQEPAAQLPA